MFTWIHFSLFHHMKAMPGMFNLCSNSSRWSQHIFVGLCPLQPDSGWFYTIQEDSNDVLCHFNNPFYKTHRPPRISSESRLNSKDKIRSGSKGTNRKNL
uniref:Putative secreted protein n=1 Tax=Anopheles darlingi TaxID=43151 RepID=A0A2M4DGC3_ANODA